MIRNDDNLSNAKGKIDIICFLRFLWKWKLLIFTGPSIFIIVSVIASYKAPKLYSVEMVIHPGIMNISNSGRTFYIDNPKAIITLINSGVFKESIKKKIKQKNAEAYYVQSRIRATLKKQTNIIVVRYEAQSAKEGEKILNILIEELSNYYRNVTAIRREEYQNKILALQTKIKISKIQENKTLLIIEHLQKRTSELLIEIDSTEKIINETNLLIKLKNKEDNNQITSLESLNYTLYQVINLKNKFIEKIYRLKEQEIDKKNELTSMNEKRNQILEQMERLNEQISQIEAIRIISPPRSNKTPIKVNIYLNVILSAVSGFIASILLSLLIEYLTSKTKQNAIPN